MSEGASSGCCSTSKGYEGVLHKMTMRQDTPVMSECDVVLESDGGKLIVTSKKSQNVVKIRLSQATVRKVTEDEVKPYSANRDKSPSLKRGGVPELDRWLVVERKGTKTLLVAKSAADAEKWMDAIRRVASSQKDSSAPPSPTPSEDGSCPGALDDNYDPFGTGRSTNYGADAKVFGPRCTIASGPAGPCIEDGFLPPPDLSGCDEICYSSVCQVEPSFVVHDSHAKSVYHPAMLFVTKFRVIVKRCGDRSSLYNIHMWDIGMVRADPTHCSLSFTLANNSVISMFVPAPSAVADALFKSFSEMSVQRHWPQLGGITKWSYDFVLPDDPVEMKDPAVVYLAQCSYVGKRASPTFLRYLQSLYLKWDRHLDLTCVASSDDDMQIILGMLERDQFFLGVSTAKCPKRDVFAIASRVVKKNSTLTLMSLRDVGLEDSKQFTEFCTSLCYACSINALTWIDLSGNPLKDNGAKSFASALASFSHRFTHIDLANCQISGKGLNAIFDAFMTNIPASVYLEYLDISGNKCDDSCCSSLDAWLTKVMENVNPLKDGAKGLSTLKMASCRASFSSMKNLPTIKSLTDLDISDNKLGDTSCNVICDTLKHVKSLRMVDINTKKEIHSRIVHAFLDPKKVVSDLSLELTCMPKSDKISTVSVQTSSLPPELLDAEATKKLQRLVLSNVLMPCVHMDQLCRTLAAAPLLSSVCIQDVAPESFAVLGSPAMWGLALAYLVHHNQSLMSLTLHGVPPDVVNTLVERVSQQTSNLTHLNVGMCNLGDGGAFNIADALPHMSSLRVIELDDNNVHVEGIHAIACSLPSAENITQVCMERDITREIVMLNSKSPYLAAQCLLFANSLAVELAKNAQKAEPITPTGTASKRLSVIEGSARTGWNSMLPREIRLISPIAESLPVADMPRPDVKKKKRTLRNK